MRIKLSDSLKTWIQSFESMDEAAKRLDVSVPTLYALLNDRSPSDEFIAKVKTYIGWDFEKAFKVEEDAA